MSKRVFKVKVPEGTAVSVVAPGATRHAAGLDVHKYHVTACVAAQDGHGKAERAALQEFKTDPRGLAALAHFLAKFPLQAVVMGATGVYSKRVKDFLDTCEEWPDACRQ